MTYWNLLWWLLVRWQAIKRVAELFCSSWIPADIKEVIELIGYRTRFRGCLEQVVLWGAMLGLFFGNAANADEPVIFHKCLNVSHTRLTGHLAEVLAFNLMHVSQGFHTT